MIATEPTTEPTTLVEVATALDERREAINALREQMTTERNAALAALAERERGIQGEIAVHGQSAGTLIARQQALMNEAFGGMFGTPTKAKRGAAKPANGPKPANIAARERNIAIRTFAHERGLECPETGSNFPQELLDAFNGEAGYQG